MIRAEHSADTAAIFQLHYEAFGNQEYEAKLTSLITQSEQFIAELSLVAVQDQSILGHALFSKASVVNNGVEFPVIALAPIAVKPAYQKQGIGGLLIQKGLEIARSQKFSHVFLIGHPSYYPRFGFQPARSLGFELKQFDVPDEVFMVNILNQDHPLQGELRYPSSFFA